VISWLVRLLLIVSGTITGWLMTKDSPDFGLLESMIALLLVALIVAVVAFWPERWSHVLDRRHKTPGTGAPSDRP